MIRRLKYIGFLMALLLMVGGVTNYAWGVRVTYHILTMPFTPEDKDGVQGFKPAVDANRQNIRVEAFYVIVDETSPTIGLPSQYVSPLAHKFRYYAGTTIGESKKVSTSASRVKIYFYNTTTFNTYTINGTTNNANVSGADDYPAAYFTSNDPADLASYAGPLLKPGDPITENCDIYVTYEYNSANTVLDLTGNKSYNIKLGDRFLAMNKTRANRPAAIKEENVTEENLNSNDFTYVATPGFNNNQHHWFHFRFKFHGPDPTTTDPYNITIYTAYEGDETFFSDVNKNIGEKTSVIKWYKGSRLFCKGDANGNNNMWLSSDYDIQFTQTNKNGELTWESTPGYYRGGVNGSSEMSPIWNSFAILPATSGDGYVFMGTKINGNGNNWQPKDGKYFFLTGNYESGNNPRLQLRAHSAAESTSEEPYEVRTYTFKVKTPLSNTTLEATVDMTEFLPTTTLLSHVPDKLKRKYVTFTQAYKSETYSDANAINTFADADAANNERVIWLDYEVDMPFDALAADGSYDDARWYTIRMNGQAEDKNIGYHYSNSYITADGSGNAKGSNTDLHQGENSAEAMVAFMGDPFEMKILNRAACETAEANCYIGCASDAGNNTILSTSMSGSSDISTWEIADDDVEGSIILRQFNTYNTPKYIGWRSGDTNKPVVYSTVESRIKVVALEKKKYLYHIVRSDGSIAVKASTMQDVGLRLKNYTHIPEEIRTPFLNPALGYSPSISFYYTKANADASTSAQNHAPYNPDGTEGCYAKIYVRYSFGVELPSNNYNVRLNAQYIYYDSSNEDASKISSQTADPPTDVEDVNYSNFQWHLDLDDPYAMTVKNIGFNKFVNVASWSNNAVIGWSGDTPSKFIVRSSTQQGVYEVMAATGEGVDAATTYYNIGRNTDNCVRMYSNASYQHGDNQYRFVLTETNATPVDYHLIDKDNHELLVVRSRRSDLTFPADYHSPLVETYHYWTTSACNVAVSGWETDDENVTVTEGVKQVYVTYDTSSRINLRKGVLYLLKFRNGDSFRQENGSDGLTESAVQAVYPYCNGDCNFFIYGQDEYDLQQEGAASTRTRWAWYLESANNDPYHVKICSRQEETFNTYQHQAYFYTHAVNYNQDIPGSAQHITTSLAWPGISGVQGTEYMILGSVGQYQLLTTYPVPVDLNGDGDTNDSGEDGERRVVKSFEQYWKTYDTVKNKLLKDILEDEDKGANPEGSPVVPDTPDSYRALLTGTGEGQYGFHSYNYWAYAKRFNGYNNEGKTSKGWEQIEHWYQTVNMGEGYFDFVATTIAPVLILLDQHGWEIMRKPLPFSDQDPKKEAKKNVIRAYDSPMVKEYYYWASAKKRSGFHQYYQLEKRVGSDYASASLGDLPPYGSENVLDAKGNLNDQYVTYTVKDEYVQSYSVVYETTEDAGITKITGVTGIGQPFLIQQGDGFAFTGGSAIAQESVPSTGGMSQWIIDHVSVPIANGYLWYLKPNTAIDDEMGYQGYAHDWVNDYDDEAKVKASGFNSWAFDPYNIQISSVVEDTKYFVTNATGATLQEGDGAILGTYDVTPAMALGLQRTDVTGKWYDSRTLYITDATFMAVEDTDGNMQLMPRFDQARRVKSFSTLVTPTPDAGDPTKLTGTYTKIYRPIVYNYHIIDNDGNESLRYKSGGDLVPQTPDHFKSPLANDFTYWKTLTGKVVSDEITESLASSGLTSTEAAGNEVYVRYSYDDHADVGYILKGKWFTMQLNAKDTKYNSGIKQGTKPSTVDSNEKSWQWKFLETPLSDPDPYAVYLFNRDYNESRQNEPLLDSRFALLSHSGEGYVLAEAGREDYTYQFLNGASMTTSEAATIAEDKEGSNPSGFTSTSCTFHGTDSKMDLIDDVLHTYKYKVYTYNNDFAIEAAQSFGDASDNEFVPELPDEAKSPLLSIEDFRYYYNNDVFINRTTVTDAIHEQFPELEVGQEIPDTIGKQLKYMYGLYNDEVFVHYMPYNPNNSSYLVPNVKGTEDGHVARGTGSHDAALGLDGKRLYNIIWYNDNMMFKDESNIKGKASQDLTSSSSYVWTLEGDDPYAFKIKNYAGTNDYISSSGGISSNGQSFMLIPWDGYGYGVLAKTGVKGDKLTIETDDSDTGTDEDVSVATTDSPTKFIFFGLATHKVIYHLVIAPTATNMEAPEEGCYEIIPYWNGSTVIDKKIPGSTQRDLTSVNDGAGTHYAGEKYQLGSTINGQTYSYDAGIISLGDKLEVPTEFYRPNVVYQFFVEGVYTDDACNSPVSEMNDLYKGHEVANMGDNSGLLNTTVRINIVYSFNGSLETNVGADFVRSVSQNKWFTFEAKKADGTPQLMQFTNAWGMEVKEGRGAHYTNDYLWTPLGDPYGFKMYHRYTCVNSGNDNTGEPNRVMTTADFTEGEEVWMSDGTGESGVLPNKIIDPTATTNSIYELLADDGTTPGYFKIHPVVNNSGTKYNLKIVKALEPGSSTVYHDYVRLSATGYTEFTYGLSEELVKPYYDRHGYVGGLTDEEYNTTNTEKKAIVDALKAGEALTSAQLMTAQSVVYNSANIVHYTPGYYRLHSPEDIEVDGYKISPVRYASGYTHKAELTGGPSSTPIPMHFYEVEGASSAFNLLKSKDGSSRDVGYTTSVATRGDIPIPAAEYDPASIFYFYQVPEAISSTYHANANMAIVSTQGLYAKGSKGPGNTEAVGERAAIVMTETENQATPLYIMDIGGGILLIHDQQTANGRANLKYLCYDQADENHIYDLKLTHNTHTDHAKWLMRPANQLGLYVATHSGGDGATYGVTYNYTTFYAPFDVLLPDTVFNDQDEITKIYHGVILESAISPWNPSVDDLHPKSIGRYNLTDNGLTSVVSPEDGRELCIKNNRFIPAGTPVLIAMYDNSGYVKLTLPTSMPSKSLTTSFISSRDEKKRNGDVVSASATRSNILSGQYLEQKLPLSSTDRIYTFGLPFTGSLTLNPSDGSIEATLPLQDNAGMGFYLNANPDKELGLSRGDWDRNNWYVYSNKAYYHATGVSSAPDHTRDVQFVPVIFGDDEGEEEEQPEETQPQPTRVGDGCVYDILGRKVASAEEVKAGTWWQHLSPGIYIVNGQKVFVGVGTM